MLLDLFSRQLSEELQGISSWILIPTSGNNQKEGVHTGTSQKKSIPSRLGAMIRAYYFHEKATDVIKDAQNHCLTASDKTNCGGTHYPPSTSICMIFEFCITIPSPSVFTFGFLRRNWKKTSAPWAWSTDEPLLLWLLVRRVALAIWLLLTETSCPSSLPAGILGMSSARRVPDWDFWHIRSMVALVSMKTLSSCMSKSTVRSTMSKLLVQRFQVYKFPKWSIWHDLLWCYQHGICVAVWLWCSHPGRWRQSGVSKRPMVPAKLPNFRWRASDDYWHWCIYKLYV